MILRYLPVLSSRMVECVDDVYFAYRLQSYSLFELILGYGTH